MSHRGLRTAPLACIGLAIGLAAQSQAALVARWEAKQDEAWFKDGGWVHDFAAAKARAAAEGKVIFAYFSRSYSP